MSAVNNNSFSKNVPPPMQEPTDNLERSFNPVVPSQNGGGYWKSLKEHLKEAAQGLSDPSLSVRSNLYRVGANTEKPDGVIPSAGQSVLGNRSISGSTIPGDDAVGTANVPELQNFSDRRQSDCIPPLNHSLPQTSLSSVIGPQAAFAGPSSGNNLSIVTVYNSVTEEWDPIPRGPRSEIGNRLRQYTEERTDPSAREQERILELVNEQYLLRLRDTAVYNNSQLPREQRM
jgi:hypothetical protein